MTKLTPEQISAKCRAIRRSVLEMNHRAGQGHTGADLSETDILASLYFRILNVSPDRLDDPDRDRFILSKGHGVGGYYCTLAEAGFFPCERLASFQEEGGLPGHPVRQKTPGIELNTGALGHGLPVAVGLALAARLNNRPYRVFVLTGDGELDEGSNWEAAMAAAHYKLGNLVWIIDRNTLQLADRTETIMALEPLADKVRAFGFDLHETDGNNVAAFIGTVESLDFTAGRPHAILARTTKGKGVSFIEDKAPWHHKVPSAEELTAALKELSL